MHDLGDLFVPFSMEQIYAQRVAAHGQARLFVSRAIRGVGHCDFTQYELQQRLLRPGLLGPHRAPAGR